MLPLSACAARQFYLIRFTIHSAWNDTLYIYDLSSDPVNAPVIAQTRIKTNYGNAEALAVDDTNRDNPVLYWTAQAMLCVRSLKGQTKPAVYPCTNSGSWMGYVRFCETALTAKNKIRVRHHQVHSAGRNKDIYRRGRQDHPRLGQTDNVGDPETAKARKEHRRHAGKRINHHKGSSGWERSL